MVGLDLGDEFDYLMEEASGLKEASLYKRLFYTDELNEFTQKQVCCLFSSVSLQLQLWVSIVVCDWSWGSKDRKKSKVAIMIRSHDCGTFHEIE
jgi:hypothetical protein